MFHFQNVIGNQSLIKTLQDSFINNRLSHSYIFNGNSGSGKKLIAFSFSKLILCQNPQNNNPCNKCNSCLTFETKNNPDVIFINTSKKSIGIDIIRENILKQVYIKPFKFKYKIFIIQNSDNMTFQAQNSLLKIIEEPPQYVKFFFLSQNYNYFLPTILSRATILKILPLPLSDIQNLLIQQYQINPQNANIYSIYSQGSIGKALKFVLIKDFVTMRNEIISSIKQLLLGDLINLYKLINNLEKYKDNIQEVLEIFLITYRDFIVFKNTKNLQLIFQKDIHSLIVEMSSTLSNKKLIKSLQAILTTKNNISQNSNFNMALEYLFFKLKEK